MFGYDASPATFIDDWSNVMYITDPAQSASLPGVVVGWNLYVQEVGPIRLQVMRDVIISYVIILYVIISRVVISLIIISYVIIPYVII